MRDPASVLMAAFTAEDPDDRSAFDTHMAMVRSSPDITLRAVTCDGRLVGSIASFVFHGQREISANRMAFSGAFSLGAKCPHWATF
jgi:predicted GNAT superfamily acetyltransferase